MSINLSRTLALAALAAVIIPNPASAAAVAQPSDGPVSLPIADSHITAKAKEWFHRLQTGEIDRSQLDAQVNSQLTADVIRDETKALTSLGDPTSFDYVRTYPLGRALEYDFMLQFKAGRVVELISFDADGKIAGLGFEPVHD
jgi:opacity protein-like surface antigen